MSDEKVSIIPEGNTLQRLWGSIDFDKWLRRLKALAYICAGLMAAAIVVSVVGVYLNVSFGKSLGLLAIVLPPAAVALGFLGALCIGAYHTVKDIVAWIQLKLAMRAALK